MSTLTVITDLELPPLNVVNSLSKLKFTIPANVQSFSFHVWYDVSAFPPTGGAPRLQLELRGPNGARVPRDGEPYLYDDLQNDPTGLGQGYVAVSVPVNAAQAANVSGEWEARVSFLELSVRPYQCTVRLCQRTATESAGALSQSYSVGVNFFYVGDKWRGTYATILPQAVEYMGNSVFNAAQLQLQLRFIKFLPGAAVTSDLYSKITADLVRTNATADSLNVFVVESMTIINLPSARGFAMLPGPQGFLSPYTCIFVSVGDPRGLWGVGEPSRLGLRIAHEMGHYLGLTHKSACLNASCITDGSCTEADCTQVLKSGEPADLDWQCRTNLMYTSNPGNVLNGPQLYLLQQAPILNASPVAATAPPPPPPPPARTPVTSLKVKIKTGKKLYAWWRGDFGGTDDRVFFSIGKDGDMKRQEVSSFWNDFEQDSDWEYTLNPMGLIVEDIARFTLSKTYDPNAHLNLFGEDAWLLDGVRITVNGKVVYERQGIDTWLANDSTAPDSWGDVIPPITQ
ncbi:MAG TPA: hypothetical protein VHG08_26950 [Longimicrobium sp.]|nr:hypothetical protein [Longimicrobium sp.]